MKILIITNGYPDSNTLYNGIFVQRFCSELKKQGLDLVVLTPKVSRKSLLFEEAGGIRIYRFWYPSLTRTFGKSGRILSMMTYMVSGILNALRVIMIEKPDVIHGNWIVPTGLIASIAGLVTRIPVVNSALGMDIRRGMYGPVRILFDIAVELSDKITVVSDVMRNRKGLESAEVIPFGVDDLFFNIKHDRENNIVISTRSLEPIYDIETVIHAVPLVLKAIPDARFIIIGSGSQETYLKALARDLNLTDKLEFKGPLPNSEIPNFMEDALVYVSTSLADGTSVSLLEAMAAGLVPVVTDIDANRSWVTPQKDGYLFKAKNPQGLARNIIDALSREIPVDILEQKRQRLKQDVAWPNMARRFINIYN